MKIKQALHHHFRSLELRLKKESLPLEQWLNALAKGTLITDKHNPKKLDRPRNTFRSVIAHEWYDGRCFYNLFNHHLFPVLKIKYTSHQTSCYVISIPENSGFPLPASGVSAGCTEPSSTCDTIILASGINTGWHAYGADSNNLIILYQQGSIQIEGYYLPGDTYDTTSSFDIFY